MSDLRSALEGPLLERGRRSLDTIFGAFEIAEFRSLETHRSCFALCLGELGDDRPVLARVHSSCVTSEFYGACDCDCAAQLDGALEAIAAEGRGVLFYLDQEGRGAGLAAKARDRMLVQASRQRLTTFEAYERMGLRPDLRRYEEVAAMTALLGIDAPFVLLTNNPDKVAALERAKLRIDRLQPLEHTASPFNVHYLSAKRRSGHVLADSSATLDAELPAIVEPIEPQPLPGRPELVRVARYLLPVLAAGRAGGARDAERSCDPVWLNLHLYVDVELGGELVVLTCNSHDSNESHDSSEPPSALACVHLEPLFDRFPLSATPARESWTSLVRAFAARGEGAVAFARLDANGAPTASERHGALVELLAHHLRGRVVAPVSSASTRDVAAPLRERGFELAPAVDLATLE